MNVNLFTSGVSKDRLSTSAEAMSLKTPLDLHKHTHTHTHTHLRPFVRDYPGEPVPER